MACKVTSPHNVTALFNSPEMRIWKLINQNGCLKLNGLQKVGKTLSQILRVNMLTIYFIPCQSLTQAADVTDTAIVLVTTLSLLEALHS